MVHSSKVVFWGSTVRKWSQTSPVSYTKATLILIFYSGNVFFSSIDLDVHKGDSYERPNMSISLIFFKSLWESLVCQKCSKHDGNDEEKQTRHYAQLHNAHNKLILKKRRVNITKKIMGQNYLCCTDVHSATLMKF